MVERSDEEAGKGGDNGAAGVTLHHPSRSAGRGHFSFTDPQTVRVGGRAPHQKKKKGILARLLLHVWPIWASCPSARERMCERSVKRCVGPFHGWDSGAPAGHDAVTPGKKKKLAGAPPPPAWSHGCQGWEGAGLARPAGAAGLAANMLSCWMFLAAKTAGAGGDGTDCRCALSRRGGGRHVGGVSGGGGGGCTGVCVQSRRCRSW